MNSNFIQPNKRGADVQRCHIEPRAYNTSAAYERGPAHLVLDIQTSDGKLGLVEIPITELQEFLDKLSKASELLKPKIELAKRNWTNRC